MKWRLLLVITCLLTTAVRGAQHHSVETPAHHVENASGAGAGLLLAASVPESADASCWEDYVNRALEIYANLAECVSENEWYDVLGYLICELSYEFGALAAFMKLINCLVG